jgi:hypothetical protein
MFTENLFLKLIMEEFDCRVANPSQEEKRKAQRISLMTIQSIDRCSFSFFSISMCIAKKIVDGQMQK